MGKRKFFITTTIPASLNFFKGNLSFLSQYYDVTAISSNRDFLMEVGKREGVNVFYIPMVRPISLFVDIVCLFKFIFFFIKERPYIVHGNTPKASFLSMISSWLVRVPIRIYMCHGLRYQGENNKYKRMLLMWMEKISCLCATKVICVSNGVKHTLIEDNICSCKKAIVVHFGSASGIDIDFFDKNNKNIDTAIDKKLGIKDTDFVFVFIGRIVKDKGISELVEAFSKLSSIYDNIHLILVGPTNSEYNRISIETEQKIKLLKNIHEFGSQKDIRPYLFAADALVLPSYREGFGMVLIEAGAMSVPVIASNIIGCNEIVIPGKNGDLVEPKNVDSLFNIMQRWINNPNYVKKMSLNARGLVVERYSQKNVWNALLAVYDKV